MTSLYQDYIQTHRDRMFQISQTQVELIAAIACFDSANSVKTANADWAEATLSQILDAYWNFPDLGEGGTHPGKKGPRLLFSASVWKSALRVKL